MPDVTAPGDAPEAVARLAAVSAEDTRGRYLNRELSWLDFNERVLALAADRSLPVLERAKFLAIFSSNLDEFFQVRIGSLKMQLDAGIHASGLEEESTAGTLHAVAARVGELGARQSAIFATQVVPELAAAGIRLVGWDELGADDRAFLTGVFDEQLFPILTPLAVDPAHPFPYVSNLSLNLAVVVRAPGELTRRLARVKVPPLVPRFVALPDGARFVAVEELAARRVSALFPGMEIVECVPFRVTRNTDYDIELQNGGGDLVAAVESVLRRRSRSKTVVRLEIHSSMSDETLTMLAHELRLGDDDVYRVDGLLDLTGLWQLVALDRPELKLERWTPITPARLLATEKSESPDIFGVIRDGDLLVHHPYESFETSVEAFIEQAAHDPAVLAIKQTLYRTSADESRMMEALIAAAGERKQVVLHRRAEGALRRGGEHRLGAAARGGGRPRRLRRRRAEDAREALPRGPA